MCACTEGLHLTWRSFLTPAHVPPHAPAVLPVTVALRPALAPLLAPLLPAAPAAERLRQALQVSPGSVLRTLFFWQQGAQD